MKKQILCNKGRVSRIAALLLAIPALCFTTAHAQTAAGRTQRSTPRILRPSTAPPPPSKYSLAARIAKADNTFGWRLFGVLARGQAGSNICVSPASVALALQMVYNGAGGSTKTEMANALALNAITLSDVNKSSFALLDSLAHPSTVERSHYAKPPEPPKLGIANALWVRNSNGVLPDYKTRVQQYYGAQVSDLAGGATAINNWVDQHTSGKIKQIVQASDVNSSLVVLTNAVYFKAVWENAFSKAATQNKRFYLAGGGTQPCKMMAQSGSFSYCRGDNFQMVSLPYAYGQQEMIVVLPDSGTGMQSVLAGMTPVSWQQAMDKMTIQRGAVQLPRFQAEYGQELRSALSPLGMKSAFSGSANFSAMSAASLKISKVIHKTYVNVDEQGTEAAAASAVLMAPTGAAPGHVVKPFEMVMDHPFLYVIRDRPTGVLLFIGTLANPG